MALPLIVALLATPLPVGGAGTAAAVVPATAATPRVFAYYYLWWSLDHWKSALGPHYPAAAATLPLPASMGAGGCHPRSRYRGNSLTDVPHRLYSQDDPGVIEHDVRTAAAAGIAGFLVNWAGSGAATQGLDSTPYNRRLQLMVAAVHKVNAQGIGFKLWLSYKASAVVLPISHINGDLSYFISRYGHDPAFDRSRSQKPTIVWQGSRKYSRSALRTVSARYRSRARILGDETHWSASRAPYLDGNAYYWSSQDPYRNPQSFAQIRSLAARVRSSGKNQDGTAKVWVAPVTPGYNTELAGGSACVPRKNGQTIRRLLAGNAASRPDAFALISWNEITEATYVAPMTRYAGTDLAVLSNLIRHGI